METTKPVKGRRWRQFESLFVAFIFMMGALANPAFTTGADVTVTGVKNYAGNAVIKSFIEISLNGVAVDSKSWDFSGGNYGLGIDEGDNQTVLIKAWDGEAKGIGATFHYGYTSDSTSGPGDLAKQISVSIVAKYRAANPFDPKITKISYSKSNDYNPNKESTKLILEWAQQLPDTNENAEVSQVIWKYWKKDSAGNPSTVLLNNNSTDNYGKLTLTDPQQTTYYFQVGLKNAFGETALTDAVEYKVSSIGEVTIFYEFLKPSTLGINPLSFPFDLPAKYTNSSGQIKEITSVKELVEAINDYAAYPPQGANWTAVPNAVKTISGWIPNTQKPAGYIITYSDTGVPNFTNHTANLPDDGNVALAQDIVLQISIGGTVKGFKLTGARK